MGRVETEQNNPASMVNSGAPAARRAAKRSPILIWVRKGNPWVDFLMASSIARGRVRTTAKTTESRNMAAILQIIGGQTCSHGLYLFDIGHPCYDQLTPVKTRYPLTSITWPYRRLKFTGHWQSRSQSPLVFWSASIKTHVDSGNEIAMF